MAVYNTTGPLMWCDAIYIADTLVCRQSLVLCTQSTSDRSLCNHYFADLRGLAGTYFRERYFFKWPLLRTPYLDVIFWRYRVDEVVTPNFDQIILILIFVTSNLWLHFSMIRYVISCCTQSVDIPSQGFGSARSGSICGSGMSIIDIKDPGSASPM